MPSKRKSSACVDYVPALKPPVRGAEDGDLQRVYKAALAADTSEMRGRLAERPGDPQPPGGSQTKQRQIPPGVIQYIVDSPADQPWYSSCTHRPSLLPIEWLSEASGLAPRGRQRPPRAEKLVKLGHLEEVKVVTRFPSTEALPTSPLCGRHPSVAGIVGIVR